VDNLKKSLKYLDYENIQLLTFEVIEEMNKKGNIVIEKQEKGWFWNSEI